MFHSSLARWLAVFPGIAALAAVAQPAPAPGPVAATAPPPTLIYKSALEGYRPFADEKPIPWKEANETVHRRGGWQAYAKEASEGTGAARAESPKGAAAAPPAQSGHSMPMPAKKEKP
ncbi:MAG: hypothetical protein DI587_35845 [Variovorax paradoxus]|uniref:Uncharacterized protein n=1 Tax=Pseudorhodoferax soli TaxID=545864 RepID=A0A368XDJ8_9BURK|nr:MAG: hypothetical protein DI583_35845 [Variovorax paradoxus]PZQ01084.1 MAG: hypothetical protein DI587_35845 [Variovorax paradoxus]RCW66051.1 hypothetical protein DES41_1119 [Pseudorhodoferax soli]